jgi:hypothetical protein
VYGTMCCADPLMTRLPSRSRCFTATKNAYGDFCLYLVENA